MRKVALVWFYAFAWFWTF